MSNVYLGCQAKIAELQPLAIYIYWGAHCGNLAAQAVLSTISTRDLWTAMDTLQELSNFSTNLASSCSRYQTCI